ncbi:hypothetical protein CSE6_021_36350 [Comamonas sp. E6]|nr:hypothetical protein CSE6_021_36350 [Comamonas sp. E6]
MAAAEKRVFLQAWSAHAPDQFAADIQQKTALNLIQKIAEGHPIKSFQALARRCSHQLTSNVEAKPTGTPNTPAEMG